MKLIAWSGADWRLLEPLLESDQLPNLAGLIGSGVIGHLHQNIPIEPAMALTTAATGVPGHVHGILTKDQPAQRHVLDLSLEPVTRDACRVPTIWDYLNASGLSTTVLNWPATYPADRVLGVVVSDRFFHAQVLAGISCGEDTVHTSLDDSPVKLFSELSTLRIDPRSITRENLRPFVPTIDKVAGPSHEKLAALATLIARTKTLHRVLLRLTETRPADVMIVCFDALSIACRHFMDYYPPRHPLASEKDTEAFAQVIPAVYRLLDRMLGEWLEHTGRESNVLLFSDHGWDPTPLGLTVGKFEDDEHLQGDEPIAAPVGPSSPGHYQRAEGLVINAGPWIKPDPEPIIASPMDIAPAVLAMSGLRPHGEASGIQGNVILDHINPPECQATADSVGVESRDPWAMSETTDDLVALNLIHAPSIEISAYRELLYTRSLAWGLQAYQSGGWAQSAEHLASAVSRVDGFKTQLLLVRALALSGQYKQAMTRLSRLQRQAPDSQAVRSLLLELSVAPQGHPGGEV